CRADVCDPRSYFFQVHRVFTVEFLQPYVDEFTESGRHILTNEIGFDGQLAVAAVDEHGKLNALGSAKIVQRIERRAGGSASEEHIIHEHERLVSDVERNDGGMDVRRGLLMEIIAVHGNIQTAAWHRVLPDLAEHAGQSLRQIDAAALHSHEYNLL